MIDADSEKELDRLLRSVADHIALEHCQEVDERYRRALAWEEVDRPPLVVQAAFGSIINLPLPWNTFRRYTYRETFESPVAMLQNMILDRVVPGLLLRDDSPLAIRNDHGTIQMASILGVDWNIYEDNFPWVKHFDSLEPLNALVDSREAADLQGGILPHSLETLKFYREKLNQFPMCDKAIQISLPDLQGPLDTAEQLWGSSIYYAFYDFPDLLNRLLCKIVGAMLAVANEFRRYTLDRLEPFANTQHGYVIPGRLLVRNDCAIVLSPGTYSEFIRPHDSNLLREIGSGAIHFCGRGEHLIDTFLEIPALCGIDLGEPHLMDVDRIYAKAGTRRLVLTNLNPSREELMSGEAKHRFPTGVVFVYHTSDLNDAEQVVREFKAAPGP